MNQNYMNMNFMNVNFQISETACDHELFFLCSIYEKACAKKTNCNNYLNVSERKCNDIDYNEVLNTYRSTPL